MEIIELILRLHPAAASAVSAFGEYPLHNICRCALPALARRTLLPRLHLFCRAC